MCTHEVATRTHTVLNIWQLCVGARIPQARHPDPTHVWNPKTECEDLTMRLLDVDTTFYANIPNPNPAQPPPHAHATSYNAHSTTAGSGATQRGDGIEGEAGTSPRPLKHSSKSTRK